MSVHGVGAAAAHPPQFTQNTQRGNRPAAPQTTTEGDGTTSVGPSSSHQPPAHGVRGLIEAGHFDGKNSYEHLVAKFGDPRPPASALEETAPVDETSDEVALLEGIEEPTATETGASDSLAIDVEGTALDATVPVLDPEAELEVGIDESLLDELAPEEPTVTEPSLLDIDSLLMEELINEQTVIEEIVEQLDEAVEDTETPEDTTDVAA